MCSNRVLDSFECYMDDLVECFEDFVKKSLLVITLGICIIVAILVYLLKMVSEQSPASPNIDTDRTPNSLSRNRNREPKIYRDNEPQPYKNRGLEQYRNVVSDQYRNKESERYNKEDSDILRKRQPEQHSNKQSETYRCTAQSGCYGNVDSGLQLEAEGKDLEEKSIQQRQKRDFLKENFLCLDSENSTQKALTMKTNSKQSKNSELKTISGVNTTSGPRLMPVPSFDEKVLRSIGLSSCSKTPRNGRNGSQTLIPCRVPISSSPLPTSTVPKSLHSIRLSKHKIPSLPICPNSIRKQDSCCSMCCND